MDEPLLNVEFCGVSIEPVHAPLSPERDNGAVAEVEEREPCERVPLRSHVAAFAISLRHGPELGQIADHVPLDVLHDFVVHAGDRGAWPGRSVRGPVRSTEVITSPAHRNSSMLIPVASQKVLAGPPPTPSAKPPE